HPIQALERALAPFGPSMQEHLAVAFGLERMATATKLLAKLAVVVDLTVENDVKRSEVQRLVGALVEIDDREAAAGDPRCLVVPQSLAVGTALDHRLGHPLEERTAGTRAACSSGDSAHAIEDSALPQAPSASLAARSRRLPSEGAPQAPVQIAGRNFLVTGGSGFIGSHV